MRRFLSKSMPQSPAFHTPTQGSTEDLLEGPMSMPGRKKIKVIRSESVIAPPTNMQSVVQGGIGIPACNASSSSKAVRTLQSSTQFHTDALLNTV